jgi:N-acetylmuramoyl-L-alanine amidase CwlA
MQLFRESLLTPNKYSRPQTPLTEVRGIAIHWVENAGTSADFNRNYFEMRKSGQHNYGSAHYIIDDRGILQCIPEDEMAYHVGARSYTAFALERFAPYPNSYLIGIEHCHPDWTGKFEDAVLAYSRLLCAALCLKYGLSPIRDIVTHNQITGKNCPKWFVENPDDLDDFRCAVAAAMRVV